MVKIPNRPPTPIGPRDPIGPPPPPSVCPDMVIEVSLDAEASIQTGDSIAVQVRDDRVRVLCRGQIIGWVAAPEAVEAIQTCHDAGRSYVGWVSSLDGRIAMVVLEGRRQ